MSQEKLLAKIDRYVYHNKENSYAIVRVLTVDKINETIVGYLPMLSEDIFYEFLGSWTNHEKFGRQFKVESYTKSNIETKDGLISYLSSSIFTGIGPVTARKIVDELGSDAIKKILDDKTILRQFGLNNIRLTRFHQQLKENQANELILIELYNYNIAGKTAMKILNKYGILTIEKLEENPYRLIKDIDGIGFLKADEIAKKMGLEDNDPRRIKAAITHILNQYTYQVGNMYILENDLLRLVNNMLNFDFDLKPFLDELVLNNELVLEDDRYYTFLNYQTEFEVANSIKRINNDNTNNLDKSYIETLIEQVQIQKNIQYTEKQKEAITNSLLNKFSIITGGPGTGKTTIIDGILTVYSIYNNIDLYSVESEEEIALMAPTGRAAKRMEQVLDMPAKTIHRHLGYGYDGLFKYDNTNPMPQKLIIIDESSMIDIYLAEKLFKAIDPLSKVIIVGDVDQLPSVGPGQVLKDLIESNTIKVSRLNEIHRQAKDSNIINLANLVNLQNLESYDLNSGGDLFLKNAYNNEIKDLIVSQVAGALNQGFDIIDDIQVLIPTYKGDIGIDQVNKILQDKFNLNKDKFIEYGETKYYVNDKVIQLVNDPENFVMNGDIGFVKSIGKTKDNKDYLIVDFDSQEVMYEKSDLDALSLAYAMSIHKSQGSEYKIVILPLVRQFTHMLKKELLYTAITRAKNFLIVLGDMKLLTYAANNLSEKRMTTLKLRLKENAL